MLPRGSHPLTVTGRSRTIAENGDGVRHETACIPSREAADNPYLEGSSFVVGVFLRDRTSRPHREERVPGGAFFVPFAGASRVSRGTVSGEVNFSMGGGQIAEQTPSGRAVAARAAAEQDADPDGRG